MEIVLLDQTRVFIYASALGVALGALYDLLAFLPDTFGSRFLRPLLDIFYCLAFMAAFIGLVLLRAGGEIRWYIPGGMVLGLTLYFIGFSPYVRLVLSAVRSGLRTIGQKLAGGFKKIEKLFEFPRGN